MCDIDPKYIRTMAPLKKTNELGRVYNFLQRLKSGFMLGGASKQRSTNVPM